jgi:protein O-GlcNAc transferase
MDAAAALAKGVAQHREGATAQAVVSYRVALRLDPALADAWRLSGLALRSDGAGEAAAVAALRAFRTGPTTAAALRDEAFIFALEAAVAALNGDRPAQAAIFAEQATALKPDMADAWRLRACAALASGDNPAAVIFGRRGVAAAPERKDVWRPFADALALSGDWAAGAVALRHILTLDPTDQGALSNLGALAGLHGEASPSLAACRRAVALSPCDAALLGNLGGACITAAMPGAAAQWYRRAADADPAVPKWRSNFLMSLQYVETDPLRLAAEHRVFDRLYGRPFTCFHTAHPAPEDGERPLRIGYLSPDFRRHVVADFAESLPAGHDRTRFDVFCYADVAVPDATTRRIAGLVASDRWRDVARWSDDRLAEEIRGDRIDILVDLAGHSAGRRVPLFARRPAPIQITWLGYPDSTGLSAMDYRLTDALADPPGAADALASETLLRLPGGFLCWRPPADAPEPAERPENGPFVFGSFNNLAKLSDETAALWAQAVLAVKGGRLALKARALVDDGVRRRVLNRFAACGLPAERIDVQPWALGYADHLSAYAGIDVALDPTPYNGTTTTCEALWMGVPVVSLVGNRHAARVGVDVLNRVGLSRLAADTPAAFVAVAVGLAEDRAGTAALRRALRAKVAASPLTDAGRFVREVETAYRDVWRRRVAAWNGGSGVK